MIQFDVQDLKAYVEANPRLVRLKWAPKKGKKYGGIKSPRQAMFDWNWDNPLLRVSRGLVIDENWNIVSRAFDKCFDYDGASRIPLNEEVTAFKKLNGFLAVVTVHQDYTKEVRTTGNSLLVSTTGTVDSEYVQKIKDYLPNPDDFPVTGTYMFECVHPTDPHIVVEKQGLHLIGYRTIYGVLLSPDDTLKFFWVFGLERLGFHAPIIRRAPLLKILSDLQTDRGEGFMIHRENGEVFKLKSPGYRISKKLARAGLGKLQQWTKSRFDWDTFLIENGCSEDPVCLDDWWDVYHEISTRMPQRFIELDEQKRLELIRDIRDPMWRIA